MVYFQICLFTFISTVFLHILVHRVFIKIGIATFKTSYIFIAGSVLNLYFLLRTFIYLGSGELLVASALLYPIMAFDYLLVISTPYLGYISPAAKIIDLVKNRPMSEGEIAAGFHDSEEIDKRLGDLTEDGFIRTSRGRYIIMYKGIFFARAVRLYRRVIGLKVTG